MIVKKSGGQIFGAQLNAAERKALDMEARRALAEHTRQHELEIEAIVIRRLRRLTGWGETRLRRFYDGFAEDLKQMTEHYEMPEVDSPWLCTRELKEEGFDIEQWHREIYPNERYVVK
jgi:hypothetical protein